MGFFKEKKFKNRKKDYKYQVWEILKKL
jgi:hypothetical protein